MDIGDILADLEAEHDALDAVVRDLPEAEWSRPTASPGWTVADQIGHLTYFDGTATLAITDPDAFGRSLEALIAEVTTAQGLDDHTLGAYRAMRPPELLEAWRAGRRGLLAAARGMDGEGRVPWYGPPMSPASFLTARLMETWAHGQDVVDVLDVLGAHRPPTNRLAHIARLGVVTRGWTYANRGEDVPEGTVRVELTGPDGELHVWGPDDAEEVVRGPIEDFCLVVIQRRHLDDTDLQIARRDGSADSPARDWLLKAQAFAGPPSDGPPPGRFGVASDPVSDPADEATS